MVKFETGKEYFCASTCDHTCTWVFKVISRTKKAVKIQQVSNYPEEIVSRKIKDDGNSEYVLPFGNYSMAPVLNAKKEIKPETIEPQKAEKPSNVLDITGRIKQRQEQEHSNQLIERFKINYLPHVNREDMDLLLNTQESELGTAIVKICMRIDLERSRG
jgi:hypothetical protein